MGGIFVAVLNMSLKASYAIIIVIFVRFLLKKAPKTISYALWLVVAFRLVVPFSFQSAFSLMPRSTGVGLVYLGVSEKQMQGNYGSLQAEALLVNNTFSVAQTEAGAFNLFDFADAGALIWVSGMALFLVYSLVSTFLLKRRLEDAEPSGKNVFEAKNIRTPFVLGLIKPMIYLPAGLGVEEREYILLHEKVHLRRKDHIIKALAFMILAVHWFNPLVWLAFMQMSSDMEMSCDEKVLEEMGGEIKKAYAGSLLSLSAGWYIANGNPLAFGEGNVKNRIENVLSYKKPGFWLVFLSVLAAAAVAIGLLMDPRSADSFFAGASYRVKKVAYNFPLSSYLFTADNTPQFDISDDYRLYSRQKTGDERVLLGKLQPAEDLSNEELLSMFLLPSDDVQEVIKKARLIYRAVSGEDNSRFYLLMLSESGEIHLASVYQNNDVRYVRWLFRLEKTAFY